MTRPAIRGYGRTKTLFPDLRHRCRGVSLKALNQPSQTADLKQLRCSTEIQRRPQAGRAKHNDRQKKHSPSKECFAGVSSNPAAGSLNQEEDLLEP